MTDVSAQHDCASTTAVRAPQRAAAFLAAALIGGALFVAGACFDPTYPQDLQCGGEGECPPGQECDVSAGVCRSEEGNPDAGGDPEADASGGDSDASPRDASSDAGSSTATLSIELEGSGFVTSTPEGIECEEICEATFDIGSEITLEATPGDDARFVGWSSPCGGATTCSFQLEGDTSLSATFERIGSSANLMFVTSQTFSGGLDGLPGADSLCQELAAAAGLEGTYIAWLSTSEIAALERLREQEARGWRRPDGRAFADSSEDLANGQIFYPPRIDENGNDVFEGSAWTATRPDGTRDANSGTCNDWSSSQATNLVTIGSAQSTTLGWTTFGSAGCERENRLWCFGVDAAAEVAPRQVDGRTAFVTNPSGEAGGAFAPGSGIESADSLCNEIAVQAELSGSYKALLATSEFSAASRFDLEGDPWVRLDGVPIADSAEALFSAEYWSTALNQTALGGYLGNAGMWSGAAGALTDPGSIETTCEDWTTNSADAIGTGTRASLTNAGDIDRDQKPCDATNSGIFCLEE